MKRWKRSAVGLLPILLFFSCFGNAERDNPLDPQSGQYQNLGHVRGAVYSYYAPYKPLASVNLTLGPGAYTTATDQSGSFLFPGVSPGDYSLIAALEGYSSDTVHVAIQSGETEQVQFNLDGLPELQSIQLTTGVINLWWPTEPSQLVDCQVAMSDPDGYADIQSVQILIPDISFADTLEITATVGLFQNKFYCPDLLIKSIHELIGKPIHILAQDNVGQKQQFGPHQLVRVVDTEPLIVAPQGKVVLGSLPTFTWSSVSLPYPFAFTIEIFRIIDQGYDTKVMTIGDIPSGNDHYTIQSPLSNGSYYWTIAIVDEYGNWNRSKPATFDVGA
ncbi:MAG: carboxypeptidase-like regulatory domain-containing protein [Candidatus Zhuqueibacterota bacterium]